MNPETQVTPRTAITFGRTTFRLLPWCEPPATRPLVYRADGLGLAGLLTDLIVDQHAGGWRASVEHQLSEEPGRSPMRATWVVGYAASPDEAAEMTLRVRFSSVTAHGFIWIGTNLGHAATLDASGSMIEIQPAEYLTPQYEAVRQSGRAWFWLRECPPLSPLAMSAGCPVGAVLSGWCDSHEQAMADAAASWDQVRAGVAAAAVAFGLRLAGPVA